MKKELNSKPNTISNHISSKTIEHSCKFRVGMGFVLNTSKISGLIRAGYVRRGIDSYKNIIKTTLKHNCRIQTSFK